MLTRACRDLAHDAAQPNQIAHRFMLSVRYPHGRQLSGAVKTGEHGGVTTICLHSIAGLLRNQRRSHHLAPMTEARELPMNAITTWSGLVKVPGTRGSCRRFPIARVQTHARLPQTGAGSYSNP